MWEAELSFDLYLSRTLEPLLRGQRIDILESEELADIVAMSAQYLSLNDYTLEKIDGHRLYLLFGGIRVRLTLYHSDYPENSPQMKAAMQDLTDIFSKRLRPDASGHVRSLLKSADRHDSDAKGYPHKPVP